MVYFGEGSGLLFIIVCFAVFVIYKLDITKRKKEHNEFINNIELRDSYNKLRDEEVAKFYDLENQGLKTMKKSDFSHTSDERLNEWSNYYNVKFV